MLNGVPRMLLIRLSAIGDVIRVLPALHALRDRYPHAQIDFAVEPKSADILADHPAIDQVLVFERGAGFLDSVRAFRAFAAELRENRYDMVVDFHGILKSGLLMKATRASRRIAFAPPRSQELSHLFANEIVPLPAKPINRIEENIQLCRALDAQSDHLEVAIAVPDFVADTVESWYEDTFDSGKQLVIMHGPVDRPEKQWPLSHFSALADLLLADGRFEVVLTWGPGQVEVAQAIEAGAHRKPVVAPVLPTLRHFAAFCDLADLFVGCDSGPMHLASAMDLPVVGLFGGTDPARHAPLRQPSVALYGGPTPFPKKVTVEQGQAWLAALEVESVYDACVALAEARSYVPA